MTMAVVHEMPNVDLSSRTTHESEVKHIQCYSSGKVNTFTFAQTFFFLERNVPLEFTKPLKGNYTSTFIEFPDIGLTISTKGIGDIDKHVCRHFLKYFSKSQSGTLSNEEKECWIKMVDCIDYNKLSCGYSRPFYAEATILKKAPNSLLVKWHDGEEEWIDSSIAITLGYLSEKDKFGAFAKQDNRGKTIILENISLIEDIDASQVNLEFLPPAELRAL